ncbi:MAG TPA: double-strand break repair protein AddB, partial [Alphaproteobacteria bacterium]|nr:double-strand break repair protein AddB [Alphaproteobacteria bacterium]
MATPLSRPAVFTVPAGVPFADRLVAGFLERMGVAGAPGVPPTDPMALARATILVPTRRAVRAVADAFARRFRGAVVLLPRILPLGELDADDLPDTEEDASDASLAVNLPAAVPPLRRQMLLARLVSQFGAGAWREQPSADQAARLAAELARLLDQVETEELSFAGLEALAPERYARHWQDTLRFFKILTVHWPEVLKAEGLVDPAARRIRLLRIRAEAWRKQPPADPVIAAGSTGSIPATADLLAVIAGLPNGALVLPGLDTGLSDDGWDVLEPSHPQYGLKSLLGKIGIARGEVVEWPGTALSGVKPERARLLSAALAPPAVAESEGRDFDSKSVHGAARGLTRIDCAGPEEEAGVIALLMRQSLVDEARTSALVTPDRDLARRVTVALTRWGIEVDDSAGVPLALTPAGIYFRLAAEAAAERFAPLPLLALLKHPLAAGGFSVGEFRRRVRAMELLALRGPRPAPGFEGIAEALKARDPVKHPEAPALARWVGGLAGLARTFAEAVADGRRPVAELVRAHAAFAEALAAGDSETGAERLWRGDDGEALAAFVAELDEAARGFTPIAVREYPALVAALITGRVVRPRARRHPRLFIWGPLEARLQGADRLILGGLNEGTWPREPDADPWMSRKMREEFRLPAPERRVGLAAHDFVQGACAPEVFLTRSVRVEGTPTVPSRWLLRLGHFLERASAADALGAEKPWLDWQARLDRPQAGAARPTSRPAPCPPITARPRRLSVTEIETWMRDPYALYARRILGLDALEPIDQNPDAAERGSIIHSALDLFLKEFPDRLPDEEAAYTSLIAIGREVFGATLARPGVRAFWWPRFERIARWFVRCEAKRR